MKEKELNQGDIVTFNSQIVTDSGKILVNKGDKAEVEEVLTTPGFFGKQTGQWYEEIIYGVKLKGLRGEWLLSNFD